MEKYELLLENAKKEILMAEHMINVTYRLVNDQKMLISVASRLRDAFANTMAAVLMYDVYYRKIPQFEMKYDTILSIFKARSIRRYNFNPEYIVLIQEMHDLMDFHRKSPIQFTRQDKLVICSDSYNTKTISAENIKNYINKAKLFIADTERMVGKNAGSN